MSEDAFVTIKRYMVPCPECGKKRLYQWKYIADRVLRNGVLCKSCVHKGEKCYLYGKKLSLKEKERLRELRTGTKLSDAHKVKIAAAGKVRYLSDEARKETSELTKQAWTNPVIRKKYFDALAETKWLKVRPDKGQLEFLRKWNGLGFKFEPNYQVHTNIDLFYIDGYDPIHNVVIEYDGKYHLKPHQQQKDLVRQQKIIDILNPKKFWRYDAVNKRCKNVIGD
jgi:hypothetical protein